MNDDPLDTQSPAEHASSAASRSESAKLSELEHFVCAQLTSYCESLFAQSRMFDVLSRGATERSFMQYVFLQYRFFRDQLHRWFGICIVKASTCADPMQKLAVMLLAEHVFVDLRDDHDGMFEQLLAQLGVTGLDKERTPPSRATSSYISSFFDEFQDERSDLYTALAVLGGRELCVALRNRRFLRDYFQPLGSASPTWIALHAELEVEHFRNAVRPALLHARDQPAQLRTLMEAMQRGVARHVSYFDELLDEYEDRVSCSMRAP